MPSSPLTIAVLLLTTTCLSPGGDPFPEAAGKPAVTSCPETPLSSGGIPRHREYLETVVKCLDKSWRAYFARTGVRFKEPAVHFHEEPQGIVCGMRLADVDAFYCHGGRSLEFTLTGRWIDNRTDLYPFKVAAHEYAHHLQTLTGLRRAYEARYRAAAPTRRTQLQRRFELQADCLAGVFMGSVRSSLARTERDWSALYEAIRANGDADGRRSHGTGAGRAYWFRRGMTTGSPAACDTWSAPASRVS
ncbi:neutral zinc metallopeptidase [Nonomuraea sp. KM90]|uniref:neutral zinc metallopeptidase n=1 Tax=Nonomuraea sp. KM90 TaxID=3457428 RepID=UPI003FCCECDB